MNGWAGPAWGEPSNAREVPVPLRASARAADAAYRADGGVATDFMVMAASVTGVSHRLAGRRGEDVYAWAQPGAGRLALVVADGVSSAGRGGEGADLAAGAAVDFLLRPGERWGEMECVGAIAAASEQLARTGGSAAAELATTLVVAVLSCGGGGGASAVMARVGDSTAFSLSAGSGWREVFSSEGNGELRTTATEVLPFADAPSASAGGPGAGVEVASVELAEGTALVLVTDGVANPLRDGPNTVAPALASVLASGARGDLSPLALAHATDFSRRGALDDRTLLVAWPRAVAVHRERG